MKKTIRKVPLEKIAREKVRKSLLQDVDSTEVEVLINGEPGLSINVTKKTTEIKFILKTSTKKVLAWLSGSTIVLITVAKALNWLMPILAGYLSKPPP